MSIFDFEAWPKRAMFQRLLAQRTPLVLLGVPGAPWGEIVQATGLVPLTPAYSAPRRELRALAHATIAENVLVLPYVTSYAPEYLRVFLDIIASRPVEERAQVIAFSPECPCGRLSVRCVCRRVDRLRYTSRIPRDFAGIRI